MKNTDILKLGNRIRLERMKNDISQEELAEKAGLSIRTISDLERGITDIRYTDLWQISRAVGVPLHELLDFKL